MGRVGVTVAVTGPTGEIGISAVTALEQNPAVDRIVGMARRRFDPSALGGTKTTYQQGDILDRQAVDELVADADVVIHLAFIIMGSRAESARVNLAGSRNVFEATVAAERPRRLVYTSSVAAYGYHSDNSVPLTEDVPPRGSPEHYYSEQKAACEAELAEITTGSSLEVFILRPCIVAGPKAPMLAEVMPWRHLPGAMQSAARALPLLKMPVPDPGFPLQLVHHDDVAAAIALAATTDAPPGAYNIAGDGEVSISDIVTALAPGAGSSRRRDRRVGGHRERAVHSVRPGVAARRAGVGRDGHQQGEVAVGLEAEVHVGGNAAGPRRGCLKRRGVSFGSPVRVTTQDYAAC
jgi:UDP-glucose 4-epimerase